jgi:hypothetical protein
MMVWVDFGLSVYFFFSARHLSSNLPFLAFFMAPRPPSTNTTSFAATQRCISNLLHSRAKALFDSPGPDLNAEANMDVVGAQRTRPVRFES